MSVYTPPSEPLVEPEYREAGERERAFLTLGLNDGQTLQHFLLIGKKYIWLVLTCALLGTGAGFIENAITPKEYRSTANIEITQDTADQFRVDTGGGYDSGYIDVTKLDTEIAILKSSTLAMATIQSLHLDQNKDFLPLGSNHVWDLSKIQDRHGLIGIFEAGLAAERYGHTNILDLSYTARNPELAAIICNTLIDNYVEHNFSQNYAATQQVSDWLARQLGDLKNRLETSQEHMLTVQKDIGLVGIDQTQSIVLSRLVDISHDVTQAESQRLVAEAKLVTMQSAPPEVLATLSGDPVLVGLKQRNTELQAEYASLNAKYGAKNPRLVEIRSELAEIAQSMKQEQATVLTRAQEEVNAATQNQDALRRRLEAGKKLGLHGQFQGGRIFPGPAGIRSQPIAVRRAATATAGGRHHRRSALHQYSQDRSCRRSRLPQFPTQVGQPDVGLALRAGLWLAPFLPGGSSGYQYQDHL